MDVNTAYQIIQFIVNKQQTGNATPARVNLAMRVANALLWKRYNGIPEEWQPGMPLSKIAFSVATNVEKVMELFKETAHLYINEDGISSKPGDFIRESTLTFITQGSDGTTQYVPVDICNDQEFAERRNSFVVGADKDNPACRFLATTIEFAPKDLINVDMIYLRMATVPVWAFTLVDNRPVYDSLNSVDPEWPDDIVNDFIMLSCQQLGINMQSELLYQAMQSFKDKGQ